MAKVIVVDASVVVAATEPGDIHHRRAVEFLAATPPEELFIHPLTLAEVLVGGVRQSQGQALAKAITAAGLTTPAMEPTPLQLATVRVTTGLKMPDAVVVATAQTLGASIATFDLDLAKKATAVGVPIAPA
jgi:predicted nucleic acid-binding protein